VQQGGWLPDGVLLSLPRGGRCPQGCPGPRATGADAGHGARRGVSWHVAVSVRGDGDSTLQGSCKRVGSDLGCLSLREWCFPGLGFSKEAGVRSSRVVLRWCLCRAFSRALCPLLHRVISRPAKLFSPICPCSRAVTLLGAVLIRVELSCLTERPFGYGNGGTSIFRCWRALSPRRRTSASKLWRKNRRRGKTWRAT